MDPHSFFADPIPAVFLNADPDPALQNCKMKINFVKQIPFEEFVETDPPPRPTIWVSAPFLLSLILKLSNFHAFFHAFFFNFSLLDPGEKMNADPDPHPCR